MPLGVARAVTTRAQAAASGLVQDGLVAEWRFDDGSGQVLTDYSGNGNHGQLGSTTGVDADDPTWVTEGLDFDGGDFVIRGGLTGTAVTAHAAFILPSQGSGQADIISETDTGGDQWKYRMLSHQSDGSRPRVIVSADGTFASRKDYISLASLFDSTPHSFGFTFGSNALKLFNDGVEETTPEIAVDSTVNQLPAVSPDLMFGGLKVSGSPDPRITGIIMYALLYNRVLTPSEMAQNHDFMKQQLAARGVTLP